MASPVEISPKALPYPLKFACHPGIRPVSFKDVNASPAGPPAAYCRDETHKTLVKKLMAEQKMLTYERQRSNERADEIDDLKKALTAANRRIGKLEKAIVDPEIAGAGMEVSQNQ